MFKLKQAHPTKKIDDAFQESKILVIQNFTLAQFPTLGLAPLKEVR